MTQRIDEQVGVVPAIESKLHLFQVGREMLRGDFVPRPHDAAFEQGEGGFDGVGVDVAHDVASRTVIDSLVILASSFPHSGHVRNVVIGEDDFHVFADILADILRKGARLRIVSMEEPEIAVALADADDHFFVVILCDVAFTAHLATNVGCVYFDFAVEHRLIGLRHRVPDAVTEIPRRLVTSDSESSLNLAGRNTFLRFAEEQRRHEPTQEGQMGIVEHSARCDGELVVTVFAVEQSLFGFELNDGRLAAEAARSLWEAKPSEQFAALGIRREHGIDVN